LDPVPATRRSWSPASSTISASFMVPQMILRRPATTLRSGDCSVGLNNSGRRRNSFVDLFGRAGVSRSKILSLYTSYMEIRIAYSACGSASTVTLLISGNCGSTDGL